MHFLLGPLYCIAIKKISISSCYTDNSTNKINQTNLLYRIHYNEKRNRDDRKAVCVSDEELEFVAVNPKII